MMVIVDTCVWSVALRRNKPRDCGEARELETLIRDCRVQLLGPIRQELLSGIRDVKQFDTLKSHLAGFPDLALETEDYVMAATFFNLCRAKGIQGSNTDFLLCAVGVRHRLSIYTTDGDFRLFAASLPIVLHQPEKRAPATALSPVNGDTPVP